MATASARPTGWPRKYSASQISSAPASQPASCHRKHPAMAPRTRQSRRVIRSIRSECAAKPEKRPAAMAFSPRASRLRIRPAAPDEAAGQRHAAQHAERDTAPADPGPRPGQQRQPQQREAELAEDGDGHVHHQAGRGRRHRHPLAAQQAVAGDLAADTGHRQQPVHRFADPDIGGHRPKAGAAAARQQDAPGMAVQRHGGQMRQRRQHQAEAGGAEQGGDLGRGPAGRSAAAPRPARPAPAAGRPGSRQHRRHSRRW